MVFSAPDPGVPGKVSRDCGPRHSRNERKEWILGKLELLGLTAAETESPTSWPDVVIMSVVVVAVFGTFIVMILKD